MVKENKTNGAVAKDTGKDAVTGRFLVGNSHSSAGGMGGGRVRRATKLFDKYKFDPLESRLNHYYELLAEAKKLEEDLLNGVYVDDTGREHSVLSIDGDIPNVDIVDLKRVEWVRGRIDLLKDKADNIAAAMVSYTYPQLKAIEVDPGQEGAWTSIVQAVTAAKKALADE